MYSELLVSPDAAKDQVMNETARATLAKACDNFPIDPKVFARDTANSPCRRSLPRMQMGAYCPSPH